MCSRDRFKADTRRLSNDNILSKVFAGKKTKFHNDLAQFNTSIEFF